jgi:type II secretory pathway pseudopilin PulG
MIVQSPQHRPRWTGFTLVELLIVMGILILLMGILLPVVMHAMKAGRKSRVQADFQTISLALEAYKTDFGDYPRFPNNGSGVSGLWDMDGKRGAELLCRALIGPGPGVIQSPPSPDNSGEDGAGDSSNPASPGPGFRTRSGVDTSSGTPVKVAQGKIWGPYLSPDKFRVITLSTVSGIATVNSGPATPTSAGTIDATAVILDSQQHTILYFPASLSPPPPSTAGGYAGNADPTTSPTVIPMYNFFDNSTVPPDPLNNPASLPLKLTDFQILMGDDGGVTPPVPDGMIDNGETATTTAPYLLWTAGADGLYGLDGSYRTDDITNFDFPIKRQK